MAYVAMVAVIAALLPGNYAEGMTTMKIKMV